MTSLGNEFQIMGAATGNVWLPPKEPNGRRKHNKTAGMARSPSATFVTCEWIKVYREGATNDVEKKF